MRLTLERVLLYYDGPQIVHVRDPIGGHYIGVWVEADAAGSDYAFFGVSPEQLRLFKGGELDLLRVITDRPLSTWLTGTIVDGRGTEFTTSNPIPHDVPVGYLPEPGLLLRGAPDPRWLMQQARELSSPVISLTVDPPEAADKHRIKSDSLGRLLLGWQNLFKHAYRRFFRDSKTMMFGSTTLNVVSWRPTSFQIVLEPEDAQRNLFNEYEGWNALDLIGEMLAQPQDVEKTVQVVSSRRGHLAGAYKNLLDVLVTQQTRLEVAWADSASDKVTVRSITLKEAETIRDRLAARGEDLIGERLSFTGKLRAIDRDSGEWVLDTPEGKRSGKRIENGPSASGMIVNAEYRFDCLEKFEQSVTGNERLVVYMTDFAFIAPPGVE